MIHAIKVVDSSSTSGFQRQLESALVQLQIDGRVVKMQVFPYNPSTARYSAVFVSCDEDDEPLVGVRV